MSIRRDLADIHCGNEDPGLHRQVKIDTKPLKTNPLWELYSPFVGM